MHTLTMLLAWGSPADPVILAVCAPLALLAVITEVLGMRAAPRGSHGRAELDAHPLNRARVLAAAAISPWPVLWSALLRKED